MSEQPTEIIGLGDLALASSTNVAADLAGASNSFGALLVGVGNAVASTQKSLTETSAATTEALAKTLVDVIAVQETEYDDAGNIIKSNSITQKLPLLNFIDPVYYQYEQVRLQGRFVVSEFTADTSASQSSSSSQGGGGFTFVSAPLFFGGSGGYSSQSQSSSVSTTSDTVGAVGQMRMYSQITPRSDVGVPKPTQVTIGPSISISAGPASDGTENGTPIRTMSILFRLTNKDGAGIGDKTLSIETDGTSWSYDPPAATKTDNSNSTVDKGSVKIILKRSFPQPTTPDAPEPDKTPKQIPVSVRLGLVTNGLTVTL